MTNLALVLNYVILYNHFTINNIKTKGKSMDNTASSALKNEKIGKLLAKLALPAVAAQLINLLYNLVDRMYIGHIEGIGELALTGVGVCLSLITIIAAFAALAGFGGAPRASIYLGKGDKENAEKVLGASTLLLIVVSTVITIIMLIFSKDLLLLFGADDNTIQYAQEYMQIYSMGTIFVQLTLGLNAFISAQGFSAISMVSVVIGTVLNIILDPIFIFALNMGVKGAALATVISQFASTVFIICFLTGKKTTIKIKFKYLSLNPKIILPCVALGLSPFIMQATESLIQICFNTSLRDYGGYIAVGAMTILTSVMQFCMMPLSGLTQGAQPIISYNYGAGDAKRVKKAFKLLLISCCVYSFAIWASVMIFPKTFALIFTDNPTLIEFSSNALRIYMSVAFVFGIQIACQQTFIALGNAKNSLFLAILRKIILLIPLIYILPLFMEDKITAVFMAEPVADILAVTTTATLFTVQFKALIKKIETKNDKN